MRTILFLGANPQETGRSRLDQELRDITEGLKRSQQRDRFNLEQKWAVRPRDVQRAMLDLQPQIVHFSGHGDGEAGLVFEDEVGKSKLVDGAALAGLFELFADQLHCVVLNGCYSEVQAKAISQHIPYVIGMNKEIGDKAAIAFAVGFYDALGAGRDVNFAFKLGCAAIRLEGIAEHLIPVLLEKPIDLHPIPQQVSNVANLQPPGGVVPIDSQLYVERGNIQVQGQQAISQPSGLLRIQAPAQMGKTSCLERLVAYAQGLNYRVVRIDLRQVDRPMLRDLDQLLQWLSRQICRQLHLQIDVADRWNANFGSKDNCSDFLENYILNSSGTPLLLCIDNLERVFSYPDIFEDFLSLLRFWHDRKHAPWSDLRLVLLHVWRKETSNINSSPFNVGQELRLPELTPCQVQDLVALHELDWPDRQVASLIDLVGGHPHLIRLALYKVARGNMVLQTLLANADRADGLYGDHLQHHFSYLEKEPELKKLMATIVHSDRPVFISSVLLRQLKDCGLIKYHGDEVAPANQLYRSYFRRRL
jgi:AAA-like domain/CHAT domain